MKALVTGATGFVGEKLARALLRDGLAVRCLVRDRTKARDLEVEGAEIHEGDVLERDTLAGMGNGIDVAYYLVHSMGRGSDGDFTARDRKAAKNFARVAKGEGVGRVVYLGGLGEPSSRHLRSRHETALTLATDGPPLTYFRAAMVVGSESESFLTLFYLVERLPVMIAPAWLRTRTQPIGIEDALAYLRAAATMPESTGREIEIGGPDVLSYGEMLDVMAHELGRRKPRKMPVPVLSPTLSSLWIGLVTPVDAGVARPLVEGLSTETVVTDASAAAMFDIAPQPFAEAVRSALDERSQ